MPLDKKQEQIKQDVHQAKVSKVWSLLYNIWELTNVVSKGAKCVAYAGSPMQGCSTKHFSTYTGVLVTLGEKLSLFRNLHLASAFKKSSHVSSFESKCPFDIYKIGNMYCLLLEIHWLQNNLQFIYKLSTNLSAWEGIIWVDKCWRIFNWDQDLCNNYWRDLYCDEA